MPLTAVAKRLHYALKALCCLAQARQPVRAQQVARCSRIPPAQAAKILYLLTWAGFVSSRRGSKGGFWLRRSPEQILIRDVAKFLLPPANRPQERYADPVLKAWSETAGASHQAFEGFTLTDLLNAGNTTRFLKAAAEGEPDRRYFA